MNTKPIRGLIMKAALLIVASVSVIDAWGAGLVVRNFKILPTDQTAINRETMKKDQNGKTAALIKIYTPVSPEDTYFDNGVMGVVGRVDKPGQIWLYIPQRSQKIQITNSRYSPLQYFFPEEILPGKTYSMELVIEGKDVTLAASVREAPIYVDGDSLGLSPVNTYLSYGDHAVMAQKGSMFYEGNISVTQYGPDRFELPMEDENLKYGDVTVTVPGGAEIWFEGNRVAYGAWHSRLRQGVYSVELRKANCDPVVENFTIVPGEETSVSAKSPVPYSGILNVEVNPSTGVKVFDGDTVVAEHNLMRQLPVGDYTFIFRKKGYVPVEKRFSVTRNHETVDTVVLRRIQYVKSQSFYAGVGFTYSKIMGVTAHIGGIYKNIGLEAGYTFGIGKSSDAYWFENNTDLFDSTCTYSADEFYVKTGYQLSFVQRVGLMPQVGYLGQRLRGGTRGNGAMCHNLSIGARLIFKPLPMLGIFVTPEYAVPVSVNQLYTDIVGHTDLQKGGFFATAGISFSF